MQEKLTKLTKYYRSSERRKNCFTLITSLIMLILHSDYRQKEEKVKKAKDKGLKYLIGFAFYKLFSEVPPCGLRVKRVE